MVGQAPSEVIQKKILQRQQACQISCITILVIILQLNDKINNEKN